MTTKWDERTVVDLILENDRALEAALLALYNRQTPTEQEAETTAQHNGVGFRADDAPFLSSLSKQVLRSKRPQGARLSDAQKLWARKKLVPRYRRQLTEIANKGASK